jgi:hypothetical protein
MERFTQTNDLTNDYIIRKIAEECQQAARLTRARAGGYLSPYGEMAERSKAAVLKTADPQGSGGSNPSLSARGQLRGDPRKGAFG